MIFIYAAAAMVLILMYMQLETRHLSGTMGIFQGSGKSTVRKMRSYKEKIPPDLSRGKLKFLHFTDFHVRRLYISTAKILESIHIHEPDFLILTGDYFQAEKEIEVFFKIIRSIRKEFDKEIYLCFGNHDRGDVFSRVPGSCERVCGYLKSLNITVLENDSALFKNKLNIMGLSDARSNKEDVKGLVGRMYRAGVPNLLITHNSDILLKMNEGSADFVLAGHTHGAQLRTPFNIEIKLLHRRDKLSQKNIIRGLHRIKNMDLYINRGLGNTTLPFRFLSAPEVLVGLISID